MYRLRYGNCLLNSFLNVPTFLLPFTEISTAVFAGAAFFDTGFAVVVVFLAAGFAVVVFLAAGFVVVVFFAAVFVVVVFLVVVAIIPCFINYYSQSYTKEISDSLIHTAPRSVSLVHHNFRNDGKVSFHKAERTGAGTSLVSSLMRNAACSLAKQSQIGENCG
ncbi:MAG: hypothetical protein IIT38_03370 [Bacteroidales bacterium]|nr:hypothetical protein [Bacteroidales bacterium]